MKVGITGTAGAGKTTLFVALTGLDVQTGGSRKGHIAVVKVPDPRLDVLYKMIDGKKLVQAEVSFSDVGGGIAKPSRDKGMDAQLLNVMRSMDAFAIVVGDFDAYARPDGGPANPLADAKDMETDLIIADLVVIEGKMERMVKEAASGMEKDALIKCKNQLEKELPLRLLEFNADELKAISQYCFLSLKNSILIRNIDEEKIGKPEPDGIEEYAKERGLTYMSVASEVQVEIGKMAPEERKDYLEAMGLHGLAVDEFIRAAYKSLDLISFFTVGGPQKEVHAWTVRRDAPALEAAGKIHSDIQRGFIRAEITAYDDYVQYNGEVGAKQAGKMKLEGKEYSMKDGDIVLFRFNI